MKPATFPRTCTVCGTTNNLAKKGGRPGGVAALCYPCKRGRERIARQTPARKQSLDESRKRYKAAHPDKYRESCREYNRRREKERVRVGAIIRKWRKAQGASLAVMANLVGINKSTWSERELGRGRWPMDLLQKLIRAGCPLPDPIPPIVYQRNCKSLRGE